MKNTTDYQKLKEKARTDPAVLAYRRRSDKLKSLTNEQLNVVKIRRPNAYPALAQMAERHRLGDFNRVADDQSVDGAMFYCSGTFVDEL